MTRVAIPVDVIPANGGGFVLTGVAADDANDHTVLNSGKVLIVAVNIDASSHAFTVVSVPDEFGRTGDLTLTVPAQATFPGVAVAGPFKPNHWNQTGAVINVDTAATSGQVKFYAVRYQD